MARPRRSDQLTETPLCEEYVVHLDAVRAARAALPAGAELAGIADIFAALADPTRARIVAALAAHELCVCDIAAAVGQSESAVSHHLRHLRALGLARVRRAGRLAYYALDDEHVLLLFRQAREHVAHRLAEAS